MKAALLRQLTCGLFAVIIMTTAAAQAKPDPWYTVDVIGMHMQGGGAAPLPLAPDLARRYFAGDFLLNWPRPADAQQRHAAALEQLRRTEPNLITRGDARPVAAVERFTRTRVVVRVFLILGSFRWHHYYYQLASYEMARDPAIDAGLQLPALERKLAGTYRGLAHGSSAADVAALLGKPDHEHPSQSLSLLNVYYARDDLHVELHDGRVYFLEHGKPGWLMPPPLPGAGPAHGPGKG